MRIDYKISNVSKGASKNDITLIAHCKINDLKLVTLENDQKNPPTKKVNNKIPLICHKEGIECIEFIDFIELLK